MNAKMEPPIGPNRARPKSRATVLLRPTVLYRSLMQREGLMDGLDGLPYRVPRSTRYLQAETTTKGQVQML
jgi:hypothetical protein